MGCVDMETLCMLFIDKWFKMWIVSVWKPDISGLSANLTFSIWCVSLIKSGSLNWPWSTKILGQFVTHMLKNWLILKMICEWLQTHFDITDKINNDSFEDLDIH